MPLLKKATEIAFSYGPFGCARAAATTARSLLDRFEYGKPGYLFGNSHGTGLKRSSRAGFCVSSVGSRLILSINSMLSSVGVSEMETTRVEALRSSSFG